MKARIVLFSLLALVATACAAQPTATPTPTGPRSLTVLTHESFVLSEDVIKEFESANNATVQLLKQPDAGQALNRAILTKDNPEADVLFGVDNTFFSRALDEDILEPYQSPALAEIPAEFRLDPESRLTPIDFGDVCLNYDKAYFADKGLEPPQSLADLTQPEYKDLLVVENPAGSSPGLAFMLATVAEFGQDGWLDYWQQLKDNGVKVVEDWSTAYYTEFSASSGKGPRPIVVSYASSPPAEVVFADPPIDEPPTAAVVAPGTCFRQIEFAGILKGTKNRDLAEKWIDFMLSLRYQEDLPLNQFVYPVHPKAKLPEVFVKHSTVAEQPAALAPEDIAANRDRWVEEWTETVL
ncbi:MAG: thiamine ABC transporter substrate-binding protein, partial [Anaerolineae bacterium]